MTATSHSQTKQSNYRKTARYKALQTLVAIQNKKIFIHQAVSKTITDTSFTDHERQFYTQLVYGTMQKHYALDYLLQQFVKNKGKTKCWVWELLALSAYQYYYLDAIPAHAIVNEAVTIAKKRGGQTLGRFVNGVLRHAFRTFSTISDFIDQLSVSQEELCALTYNLPVEWVNYFKKRFGYQTTLKIAESFDKESQINIRIAYNKDSETICRQLEQEGYALVPSQIAPRVFRVLNGNPAHSELFKEGAITIQDESASLAVEALDPKQGDIVLDACAAPGGKTIQIAERVGPTGRVFACDIAADKEKLIQESSHRMNVSAIVHTINEDARQLNKRFKVGTFDRILVDAPCSGVGLFRRKPDTKYSKTLSVVRTLSQIQREILEAVYPLLKPGGTIVYSTCTITKEENQQVVEQFVQKHPDIQLKSLEKLGNMEGEATQINGTVEILPHYYDSDGFFIAAMQKEDEQELGK